MGAVWLTRACHQLATRPTVVPCKASAGVGRRCVAHATVARIELVPLHRTDQHNLIGHPVGALPLAACLLLAHCSLPFSALVLLPTWRRVTPVTLVTLCAVFSCRRAYIGKKPRKTPKCYKLPACYSHVDHSNRPFLPCGSPSSSLRRILNTSFRRSPWRHVPPLERLPKPRSFSASPKRVRVQGRSPPSSIHCA